MQASFTSAEILALTEAKGTRGSTSAKVTGIAALKNAAAGDLSFLGNAKYKGEVTETNASVVLLPLDYQGEPKPDQLFVLVEKPSLALARLCARIEQSLWPKPAAGIHSSAVVAKSAQVAASATIGPLCVVEEGAVVGERVHLQAQVYLGRGVQVGDDSWFLPGVTISNECTVGKRVRLDAGVKIGSDGFGYEFVAGRHQKVPQVGIVAIEDDVEVGANTTIDRARFSRTVIGEGTKIDNLVQIGHNVVLGRHCMICAQTGISGSTTLEDYVVMGGQVGVAGHIRVGKGVKVGAQSGVANDTEPGSFINGTPAINFTLERRLVVLYHRLPELFRRVDALEDIKKSSS